MRRIVRIRLVMCIGLFSLFIFAGGCQTTDEPFVGEEGGETSEEGGDDSPCNEKSCGDSCTPICPEEGPCNMLAVEYNCRADGECTANQDEVICDAPGCTEDGCGPMPDYDMAACWDGMPPNLSCQPTEEGGCGWTVEECAENPCNLVDCATNSTCVVIEGEAVCVPLNEDPCAGKSCGDPCSTCPPDAPCLAVEEFCTEEGVCTSEEPSCEEPGCTEDDCGPMPDYDMAACWDGTPPNVSCQPTEEGGCSWTVEECAENPCNLVDCETNSTCVVIEGEAVCVPLNEDPCAGKSCGDTCSTCPPDAPCPAVEEFCNEKGVCGSEEPSCDEPGCTENDCGPMPDYDMAPCWDGTYPNVNCQPTEEGGCGWTVEECSENPCNLVDCETNSTCVVIEGEASCVPLNEDPCAGLSCGDTCSTCPPDAPCPGVEEFCTEEGVCGSEKPSCDRLDG